MIKLIQRQIDLHHVIIALFDEIADDQVEFAAVGQGVARPAAQVLCGFQIQLQRKGQGDSRGLGGFIIGVIADLGEVLLGQQGLLVDFRILLAGLVDQLL